MKPISVDQYIASFPKDTQRTLKQIRGLVKKNVKGTEEAISYGIAMFKLNGRMLLYFAGFKNHVSIYPVPRNEKSLEKDFSNYYTSGKGTIRFDVDKPLPTALIVKIIKYMAKQNALRTKLVGTKKPVKKTTVKKTIIKKK